MSRNPQPLVVAVLAKVDSYRARAGPWRFSIMDGAGIEPVTSDCTG